jgi:hypothetical protein
MGPFTMAGTLAKRPTLMPLNMATDGLAGLRVKTIRLNGQTMKIDPHTMAPGMSSVVAC